MSKANISNRTIDNRSIGLCLMMATFLFAANSLLADTIFSDGFEGAFPGSWVVGNNNSNTIAKWGDNNAKYYSGSWSAFCADNGSNSRTTYDNGLNTYMQRQNISLAAYSGGTATLSFRYWMNTETSYDTFQVNVRSQSGTWSNLLTISGTSGIPSTWLSRSINLNAYCGQSNIIISFDFVSDNSVVPSGEAGVWIDDVSLTATSSTSSADLALTGLSVSPSIITALPTQAAPQFTACSFNIANNGPASASSPMVEYYLSSDTTFGNADDVKIGDTGFSGETIPAGGTLPINLSPTGLGNMVRFWPSSQQAGNYYVYAKVSVATPSDPTPNNNYGRTASTIGYSYSDLCGSQDINEPDNTPLQARPISNGETQSHTIHTDGDVDWLVVQLNSGEQLIVETSNLAGSNPDTVLELYDNNCNWLASDNDGGGGLASRILWSANYTGPHYIKVSTYGGSLGNCSSSGGGIGSCCYEVSIEARAPVIIFVDANSPNDPGTGTQSDPYRRIQDGINAAINKDTVIVAQGRYYENINFNGKNIILTSTDPNDPNVVANTIIDGNQAGSVITFVNDEDANCILMGFTITHGFADSYGGGIRCENASPTVYKCTIRDNSTSFLGGGMYTYMSNPSIRNCIFTANSAAYGGGGITIYEADANFINCSFIRNFGIFEGGGVGTYHANFNFINCSFVGNVALSGGGLYSVNYDWSFVYAKVENCLFIGNQGAFEGGGIYRTDTCLTVTNSTIVDNSAQTGGGIYSFSFYDDYVGYISIYNSIIWNNTAEFGSQIVVDTNDSPVSFADPLTVFYSNIEGGEEAIYFPYGPTIVHWSNNIDVDPLLTADVHLRFGSPCVDTGDLNVIVDPNAPTDIDGENRIMNGRRDIGTDEFLDSDGDHLPDWWEQRYFSDINIADPNADSDGDGFTNCEEYELFSSNPIALPYYVDAATGNDLYDGLSPTPQGGGIGPKKTIQAGINAAGDGDTVVVAEGTYIGLGNRDLDFGGKAVILKSMDGATSTVIDCDNLGRAFNFHSGETPRTAVIGFTITNGLADKGGAIRCDQASPQIRRCVVTGNDDPNYGAGGIYTYLSTPTLADCNITDNESNGICIEYGGARIQGDVLLAGNDFTGHDLILTGDGTLYMDLDTTLHLADSRIRCNVAGIGTIRVDLGSELIIEKNAVVDLGHATDPNLDGLIICDGLLRLRGNVTVTDARVFVSRASFEDNAIVSNCVITAKAGDLFGQFFIEDNVEIWLPEIKADGDRYLDLDPTEFDVNNIHIGRIDVNITEGTNGSRGGLFELRGKPGLVSIVSCDPNNEFFCHAQSIPSFDSNNWAINKLELVDGAKVNLTNRFDFQPPYDSGGDEEVLYVKNLILGPNSVLNTAFNHIYYENLNRGPNSVVENVPLLGFSLNMIGFDNNDEFATRVKHNNYENKEHPSYSRAHVEHVAGLSPDTNGLMRMRALQNMDPMSPTYDQWLNAKVKGTFAKAIEDAITIKFEYLFADDPYNEAELVVYLSDSSVVNANLVEVARIHPPESGRPGSVGSGQFATFSGTFPRGSLNFIKGTYVALELSGRDANCLINNWDPQVFCLVCGDYDGWGYADVTDYLLLLAEYGLGDPAGIGKGCLDLTSDGIVGVDDLVAWDGAIINLCGASGGTSMSMGFKSLSATRFLGTSQTSPLLVFGKPPTGTGGNAPKNYSYGINTSGVFTGNVNGPVGHGRFVSDGNGIIYEVDGSLGLIRQDNSSVIVSPNTVPFGSSDVTVGFNDGAGPLLSDVAFSPTDSVIVYVVPVKVDPNDGTCPYLAAAKLQLTGGGNFSVLQLYGKNPATDPSQKNKTTDCDGELVYEPDVQHLSEIEFDGVNLFVLSSCWFNQNNWVLIYDAAVGNGSEVRVHLSGSEYDVPGPTELLVSPLRQKVYITSSTNELHDLKAEVYRFSMNKSGQNVTGLSYAGRLDVNCPEPNICSTYPALCNAALGYICTITSMAENRADGTMYVTGFTAPRFSETGVLPPEIGKSIFTTPVLAVIPAGASTTVDAHEITGCDLVLPLSLLWTGTGGSEGCAGADLNGNGFVDLHDFSLLAMHWFEMDCHAPDWCEGADLEPQGAPDGEVDMADLAILVNNWLKTGCNNP